MVSVDRKIILENRLSIVAGTMVFLDEIVGMYLGELFQPPSSFLASAAKK
jgi:hypothetical protein